MSPWRARRWWRLCVGDDTGAEDVKSGQKIGELGMATCDEAVHGFACNATGLGFFRRHFSLRMTRMSSQVAVTNHDR